MTEMGRRQRRRYYLDKAAFCRQVAASAPDQTAKAEYGRMAKEWRELAQSQSERRADARTIHHISSVGPATGDKTRQH